MKLEPDDEYVLPVQGRQTWQNLGGGGGLQI